MIDETLKSIITKTLETLDIETPEEVKLEHPANLEHGDYSSNVAMELAGRENSTPRELAEEIVDALRQAQGDFSQQIREIEVAGPGFINFHLSPAFFTGSIQSILEEGDTYGRKDFLAGQKTIFEYTTQNLMKEFHVGHLMSHVIGNAVANIYAAEGAEVKRDSYQGDVGMHIGKVIWAIQQDDDEAFPEVDTPAQKAEYLGEKYAAGDQAFSDNEAAKSKIEEINEKIYKKSDPEINEIYEKASQWSKESYQALYDRLGVELDFQFFESETAPVGKGVVKEGLEADVFEENDGAVIYRGDEDEGLHTRVFINSAGIPTYEAKDIGLMQLKYEAYPYDESVIFTANEQNQYFEVVLAAASEVIPDLAEKNTHIGHGLLQLSDGKMSSRSGDVLSANKLLDMVKTQAKEKIAERLQGSVKEETAEAVAQAAVRYSILKQDAGKNVVFDTDQALSFEGNSGPYLQYTYARCQSVLKKAESEGVSAGFADRPDEIVKIEKILYRFPEVLERSTRQRAPHFIATYLHDLARDFNTFYGHTQIVADDKYTPYRLALTAAVAQVLKNGLRLLGIDTPEEM